MFRRKLTWASIALAGALIGLSVSAQQSPPPPAAPVQLPFPPGGGGDYFAPNLGIYYTLVPYSPYGGNYNPATGNYNPANPPGYGGFQAPAPAQAPYPPPTSYGARLTRYPLPESPAAFLQLEPGDMIVSLDGLPIYSPADVNSHRFQTTMVFVNVRTGLPQSANVVLP